MLFNPCVLFYGVAAAQKQPRLKQYLSLFMYNRSLQRKCLRVTSLATNDKYINALSCILIKKTNQVIRIKPQEKYSFQNVFVMI